MTGKVVKHEERGFQMEIVKAPPGGFDDMVGQVVAFWVGFMPTLKQRIPPICRTHSRCSGNRFSSYLQSRVVRRGTYFA